jgi:hypothetical protein
MLLPQQPMSSRNMIVLSVMVFGAPTVVGFIFALNKIIKAGYVVSAISCQTLLEWLSFL